MSEIKKKGAELEATSYTPGLAFLRSEEYKSMTKTETTVLFFLINLTNFGSRGGDRYSPLCCTSADIVKETGIRYPQQVDTVLQDLKKKGVINYEVGMLGRQIWLNFDLLYAPENS